jgi:hypothetical protein
VAPDFLAVIDFDRKSGQYGQVLRTVPPPSPGNTGNEPHHCHTSADQTILACGGLLSVLKGQNDIFFFDITDARHPRFLSSTKAPNSPSEFVNPATTLNAVPGDLQLRSSLRFWDLQRRRITRTVLLPDNAGTMDAKLIPGDPHGRAVTVNMFTGLMYSVDPTDGSYEQAFDTETITPHVATEVRGACRGCWRSRAVDDASFLLPSWQVRSGCSTSRTRSSSSRSPSSASARTRGQIPST